MTAPRADGEAESLQDSLRAIMQLLPAVAASMRRRLTPPSCHGAQLAPRHGAALSALAARGPLTVGQLGAELGISLPAVSGIVADVEQAGFVERSPDPGDRRRTIVSLVRCPSRGAVSGSGERVDIGPWLTGSTAPVERALSKLRPDERAALVKAMTYLHTELGDLPASPAGRSS